MVFHTSVTAVRINFQPVQKLSVELVHAWWLIDGTLISQSTKVSINDSHDVTRSCTKSLTFLLEKMEIEKWYSITLLFAQNFWQLRNWSSFEESWIDCSLFSSVSIFINFILIYSFIKIFKSCNIILRAYYVELF